MFMSVPGVATYPTPVWPELPCPEEPDDREKTTAASQNPQDKLGKANRPIWTSH